MATASVSTILITFTGDAPNTISVTGLSNALSPAETQILSLSAGANTITAPAVTGIAATAAVLIIPPAGNIVTITLKGVTGDTGVPLNPNYPSLIAVPNPTGTFVLTAGAGGILGVRLVWI